MNVPDFRKPQEKGVFELLTLAMVSFALGWLVHMLRTHVALELYGWHVMPKWEALPELEYWFAFWALYVVTELTSRSWGHKQDKDNAMSWPAFLATHAASALGVLLLWFGGWLFI